MNYKYTLEVKSELDEMVCRLSCFTLEGVQEELCRKAEIAISEYEDCNDKEQELLNEITEDNEITEEDNSEEMETLTPEQREIINDANAMTQHND